MPVLPLSHDLFIQWMQQGIEKGYIRDCDPTLNGQTYLSTSFIHQHSIDHVRQCKGRTTATRLAETLNLPLSTMERHLDSLCVEQEWTLIDDHLLTKTYLDELKLACTDRMKETGFLSLVAQTQATSLPYRILQKTLDVATLDGCIQYSEISDLLFTKVFVDQQKHHIMDHLQSATEPLAMQKLQKDMELSDSIFYLFLDQIIKEHTLQGTLRGRRERALFIPHAYRDTQWTMIDSLLKAGNYIEYHTVDQLYGFAAPKDVLQKLDTNIMLLDTCAVTESTIVSFEETLLSISDFTWLDAATVLPPSLSLADITTLLETILPRLNNNIRKQKKASRASPQTASPNPSRTQQQSSFVLLGRYVTTTCYLETNIIDNAQPFLNQRATVELSRTQKFLHSNKGKRRKDLQVVLTNEEIHHHLVEEQLLPSEFAALVTTKIKRPLMEGMDNAMKKVYINTDVTQRESNGGKNEWLDLQGQHLKSLLDDLRSRIIYNMKSIAVFEDPSTRKSMEKYSVRQFCGNFMFYLVLIITLWQSKDQTEMLSLTGLRTTDIEHPDQVDDTQKTQVIAALVSSDITNQKEVAPLQQALLAGKKMDAFAAFISSRSSAITKRLGWAEMEDEEDRRQLCATFRANLQQQLEQTLVSEPTAPSVLHLTSLLWFEAVYHLPLNVSGKYVPAILTVLAPKLQSKAYLQLEQAQQSIMASMKSPGSVDLDLIRDIRQLGLTAPLASLSA